MEEIEAEDKDVVRANRVRHPFLTMDKGSLLKRRDNLLYQLRRKGIRCNTRLRLIFIPYESDSRHYSQVKRLCEEYHFNIQYEII